ncbi:MAG: mechanosensitive ion channel family protein [Acidimicrobiales bacterium]
MVFAAETFFAPGLTPVDWLIAGGVLLAGLIAGRLLRAMLVRRIGPGDEEPTAVEWVGRIVTTVATVTGLLFALSLLGVRLGPAVGALGIGGLAIALAAQSILANFLASLILQVRRPFKRGDQVETNDCEGIVEDINFRTVVLRSYGGERMLVPCAEVLSKPIVNYSAIGRRRTTLEVGLSYDADLDRARDVLLHAVPNVDGVRTQPPPEVWVVSFDESAITLAVRFWHAPDVATLWRVRSGVAIAARRALEQAGIKIPFPQRVLHFAESEMRIERAEEGARAER